MHVDVVRAGTHLAPPVPAPPREQRCPHNHRTVLGRRPPILNGSLSQRLIPRHPRNHDPTRRVAVTRHQRWFALFTLSAFSSSVAPSVGVGTLGLSPELRTRPSLATHARAGTSPGHWPESHHRHQVDLQPTQLLTTCDLVSQLSAADAGGSEEASTRSGTPCRRSWTPLTQHIPAGSSKAPLGARTSRPGVDQQALDHDREQQLEHSSNPLAVAE